MTKTLLKNTFREIKNSKARFISIMAIIALGVGFFAGIKATVPSMYDLVRTYCDEQQLMDYRLVSTVGFDEDDIEAVSNVKGVTSVMPSYFCDVQTVAEIGGDVVRVIALPKAYNKNSILNELVLKSGRLPEKSNEIAVDSGSFKEGGYSIGDKIIFSKNSGEADAEAQLNCLEYTVVGMIQSPLYISYQRGTTTVGNGKIADYMYIPSDSFSFDRYTELYVKTDISDKYSAYSDDYNDSIDAYKSKLEDIADERCNAFDVEIIKKAENDLQDAKNEYNDSKSKIEKQLSDAQKQLDDGEKKYKQEIASAQKELDSAKLQIETAKSDLAAATDEYYAQISSAETVIAQKEAELERARTEYNSSKEEFDNKITDGQAQLDQGADKYNTAYNDFVTNQEPLLLSGIAQAQTAVNQLTEAISQTSDPMMLAALNQQLEQAQITLDNLNSQYDQALNTLEQSKAELDKNQQEFEAAKYAGQQKLDEALAQISDGERQLDSAKAELQSKRTEGYAQLISAQQQIDDAQSKYNSGINELQNQKIQGRKNLDNSRKELEDKRTEADEKFSDTEKMISENQKKLDDMSAPKWYLFNRNDNPGFSTFTLNADRLNAVSSVFPLFFLLVAVLVCVTTMTRLIEEKRTEIGTIKALGYSNLSIVMKFVIYSLLAAVFGGIIGILIGINTIPYIIYNAYKIMYYIGDITLIPDYTSIILGILAAVACTTAVSVIVCMRSLNKKLATLMRPKAPKIGKRIILERIKPLWSHMGFNSKLTARNLLRYKSRLCMTVIGVAGCTALIVAAFGLLNSFDPLIKDQFETIYKYNAVVVPSESGTIGELKNLEDKVSSLDNVKNTMLAVQEECKVSFNGKLKESDTYLSVVEKPDRIDSIISLHTRKDKITLNLTDEGVLINEKLCEEFGINVGDTICLDSDSGKAEVKVCGIFEQYIHNYIYMTPNLYKAVYGEDVKYNMLEVKLDDASEKAENNFSSAVLKNEKIAAVNYIASSLDDFKNMLNSLNMVVFVMIICAAALAFVVLYNHTNINIAERVREIATFKVLGFYNKETSAFIYKENIILTILGIAAGLIMGIFLTGFIVNTVEVDNIMFGRNIYLSTYLYAAGFTMLFSLLVNAVMSFKIKAVNMVESLKSVE